MRQMFLADLQGKGIDLPVPANPAEPYAVLMVWPVTKVIATVVAFADGAEGVYYRTGGGFLGGGSSSEKIRQAALNAVAVVAELRAQMLPTKEFPLPARGTTYFYAVSHAGVFTVSASTRELENHSHPLSRLGDPMQAIFRQGRLEATRV
jgi:hypothetical protein